MTSLWAQGNVGGLLLVLLLLLLQLLLLVLLLLVLLLLALLLLVLLSPRVLLTVPLLLVPSSHANLQGRLLAIGTHVFPHLQILRQPSTSDVLRAGARRRPRVPGEEPPRGEPGRRGVSRPPGIRTSGNWGPHCVVRQWGYQVVPCTHVHVLPFQSLLRNPRGFASRPSRNRRGSASARPKASPPKVLYEKQRESPHSFPSLPLPPAKHAAARRTRRTANVGEEGGRPQGTGKEKDEQEGGGGG